MARKKTMRTIGMILFWLGIALIIITHVSGIINDSLGNIITHSQFMILSAVGVIIGWFLRRN